jgi:hypothetical protein
MSQQFRSPSPNTPNTGYLQRQQPSQPSQPSQPQPSRPYTPQQNQWSQPVPQTLIARPPQIILPETPKPTSPRRRSPGAGRKGAIRLLLIGMALCVVVALASIYAFTRGNSLQPPATPQARATQPAGQSTRPTTSSTQGATSPTSPTSKPTTQATTGSNPTSSAPVLGGGLSAFTTKYGQPNNHSVPASGLYHFKQYPVSNLDFLIVNTDLADGSAYANRVESITAQAPDAGWSQQEATAACAAFLPPDAVYKQQINLTYGYDNIYSSASLAQLFPSLDFVDVNGKQVQAGLFDVQYLYQHGTKNIVSCSFMIGTQQTQI